MSVPRLSTLSTEYLKVPVTARRSGAAYDPTGDTVEFALTLKPAGSAADQYNEPSSWTAGAWWTEGGAYYAVVNVGPTGSITSASTAATYQFWIKISSSPEAPVKYVGDVMVF